MNINFGSISGTDLLKDLFIIILLVIVLFQRECNNKSPLVNLGVKTTTQYIHDTISIPSQPQKPQISYIDTGSTKWRPVYVVQKLTRQDSGQIVSTYLKPYFYTQDFKDEQYKAHLSAVVTHDSLFDPQLSVQWLTPLETINSTSSAENLKVFIGLHLGASPSQFNFGPEITLLTKTDHLYGISNDLALKQPNVELHMAWKIHL
jgi:hypothetical protein